MINSGFYQEAGVRPVRRDTTEYGFRLKAGYGEPQTALLFYAKNSNLKEDL